MKFWVIYEQTSTGFSGYIPDLPGCVAAAGTLDETQALMKEAVTGHLSVMREFGETIPVPTTVAAEVEITEETFAQLAAPVAA